MNELLTERVGIAARQLVKELANARSASGEGAEPDRTEELVFAALDRCLEQLAATGCRGEENRVPSSELWRIAGDWLTAGSLQYHARTKPRGYAGDFEMLEKICADVCCDDPWGRIFDRYFQQQAAPQAVRNRTDLLARAIADHCSRSVTKRFHVVSIGAGPAIEIQRALQILTPPETPGIRVTLLDLDPLALDHAQRALAAWLPPDRLTCRRENLYRLPQRDDARAAFDEADFLFCAGLFDYLDEPSAVAMLAACWRWLAVGGRLMIFNFSPLNPSRAYMEWIGNWYLTYRDQAQMDRLARQAGLAADRYVVGAEAAGVNLFVDAGKP